MTKDEYIIRSLYKIKHKPYELFIISRIIHNISLNIEFVCQQLVRYEDGKIYMTDIYFPQFGTHLEIDERHHESETNLVADKIRTREIVAVTGHDVHRIKTHPDKKMPLTLEELRQKTDEFIRKHLDKNKELTWDFEAQYDPKTYIDKGVLDIADRPAFRSHRDALRCFGYTGGHYQRAVWPLPKSETRVIWFPKLYKNEGWHNALSADGKTITEQPIDPKLKPGDYKDGKVINKSYHSRITFAHYQDELGKTLYRFLGEFELDRSCIGRNATVFQRTRSKVELSD